MGRHDFRPLRVQQTASQLLSADKTLRTPPWFPVISSVTPSQALVRNQPVDHGTQQNSQQSRRRRRRKPSKMFKPLPIRYEEDDLRSVFFSDHPWELARPRVVLEDGGRDWEGDDWSHIRQKGRGLSGESVIQRQLHLMHHSTPDPPMPRAAAYDQARKEFYALRLKQQIERRVSVEEATATGAYFGKSALEIGQELEDRQFEEWKAWAEKEVVALEQRRASMYSGSENAGTDLDDREDDAEATEDVADEEGRMPAQGQEAPRRPKGYP